MRETLTTGHICCGAGGDILGAKLAGAKPLWAVDKEESCVNTVTMNHGDVPTVTADIRDASELRLKSVDIAICGIPCQPYTRIGRMKGESDERAITDAVITILERVCPQYIIFENIREYEKSEGFEKLKIWLAKTYHHTVWQSINVADYGVPQRRRRLMGIATKSHKTITMPLATHTQHRSLFDNRESWIRFGNIRDGHGMKSLSAKAIKGVLRRYGRHSKKGSGFSVQVIDDSDMMMTVLGTMYCGSGTSSNTNLVWDEGKLRNVSFMEARRAQGFPDEYIFCGTKKEMWQQVSNAIPPQIAQRLIEQCIRHYNYD